MPNSPLKVGFYVGELPAPTFIIRLAEGLAKQGTQITLYGLIKKPVKYAPSIRISGPKDGKNEGRSAKFKRYLKYTLLLNLFKKEDKAIIDRWLKESGDVHWGKKSLIYPIVYDRPDILHVQWAKDIGMFAWANLFNIKLVLSLRGAHINYSPITHPALAEVYKKAFPNLDGFHAVSKAIAREASKYGADLQKTRVVYSGFNIAQFPFAPINSFETLGKRSLRIVSVGRSHWKKGYHFALDAMAALVKKGADVHYTIVGASGVEELEFQRHQLALTACVDFVGNMPFAEVKELIKNADVLLLPSVEEGVANVVLEAMLLGTLVVTTDCGGMEEAVTDGVSGFVVPLRNPEAIADALMALQATSPEKLKSMVQSARQKVAQQHTEEKMVGGMLDLYNSIVTH